MLCLAEESEKDRIRKRLLWLLKKNRTKDEEYSTYIECTNQASSLLFLGTNSSFVVLHVDVRTGAFSQLIDKMIVWRLISKLLHCNFSSKNSKSLFLSAALGHNKSNIFGFCCFCWSEKTRHLRKSLGYCDGHLSLFLNAFYRQNFVINW